MKKQNLKITGMHCTSCAMLIDGDLEDLKGVKSAKTNFAKQETEVEFDESQISTDALIATVKETGYKASVRD